MATFTAMEFTHILILCPRGFANERNVYAIPADCLPDAEAVVRHSNPEGAIGRTRIIPFESACNGDKVSVGNKFKHFPDVEEYRKFLYEMDGPLFTTTE